MHFFFEPFDEGYIKKHLHERIDTPPPFFAELESGVLNRRLFKDIRIDQLHDCLCFARTNMFGSHYNGMRVVSAVMNYDHSGFSQSIFLSKYFTKSNAKLFLINNHLAMEAKNSLTMVKIIEHRIIPILRARSDIKKEVLQTWVSIAAEQLIRYGKAVEANQLLDILGPEG